MQSRTVQSSNDAQRKFDRAQHVRDVSDRARRRTALPDGLL